VGLQYQSSGADGIDLIFSEARSHVVFVRHRWFRRSTPRDGKPLQILQGLVIVKIFE
jgi:hypothetical protein